VRPPRAGGAQPQPLGPPPKPGDELWRTAWQADGLGLSEATPYPIQLEPPEIQQVAQSLQTDRSLEERIRQEHRERTPPERVTFPASPVLSTETYQGRSWEPHKLQVAPNYVVYGKLLFQQPNFERYGWDLGVVTPVVSAATFYWDFVTMPYHVFADPCRCMDSNAGYCLPGDSVPLMLYPPEISLTGALAETAAVLALVAIFP
jgi:hypothetical protein